MQHRQEPIDRHLLSPSDLGLLHLVASPLSILDDHQGDYDEEYPQDCKPFQGEHLGWGEGLTSQAQGNEPDEEVMKKQKTTQEDDSTKDTTTTSTLH